MLQKIKTHLIVFASLFAMAAPLMAVPVVANAAADVTDNLCDGSTFEIDTTAGGGNCNADANTQGFNDLLRSAVNIISAIVGVVAVIMIIVGGFKYITSGGDSQKISSAKSTLIYAIIGLVIVALAQLIVQFVIGQSNQLVS